MMRAVYVIAAVLIGCCSSLPLSHAAIDALSLVNPFIGTGGYGYGTGSQLPGAQVPFGMAKVTPDTSGKDMWLPFDHYGGYHYHDTEISSFSHIHSVGAGNNFLGYLGIMPFVGPPKHGIGTFPVNTRSSFSHKNESASPGFYSVTLLDANIQARVTASGKVGVSEFTFVNDESNNKKKWNKRNDACMLIDITKSTGNALVAGANITYNTSSSFHYANDDNNAMFSGVIQATSCDAFHIYFVVQVSSSSSSIGEYGIYENNDKVEKGQTFATGNSKKHAGAYVCFSSSSTNNDDMKLEVRVGLSIVSHSHAAASLKQQSAFSFQEVLSNAEDAWRSVLSRISLSPNTNKDTAVKFMTAVYHTAMAPTLYSEELDNATRGCDDEVRHLTHGTYSDLSMWDIHRSEFPWLVFFAPDVARDTLKSMAETSKRCHFLPKWHLANCDTCGMTGEPAAVMFADGVTKGVLSADSPSAKQALEELVSNALNPNVQKCPRADVDFYTKHGYVRFEETQKSCTVGLEYAYDDFCISELAKLMGNQSVAHQFNKSSMNWKNNWNPDAPRGGFFCSRYGNGTFVCPPSYTSVVVDSMGGPTWGFVEGDAWQYRFFVPHDLPGLVNWAFDGPEHFAKELNFFFQNALETYNATVLPNEYYWAGNEPDLLSVWEFGAANRPDLTQKWTRTWNHIAYENTPGGLPGNDDFGTLSAWFVWSTLGLYPLSGTTKYILGSPDLPAVQIQTDVNQFLTISTDNWNERNLYVSKVLVNGESRKTTEFVFHEELMGGNRTLHFVMSATPVLYV